MPNVSAHMIVAKEVSKQLNIDSDDFIRGNLLPDIIRKEDSHHKISNGNYMIPDIEYFLRKIDFNNYLHIGYLTHLLLDKHFLNEYINSLYPNVNLFKNGIIYKDYDLLNESLVNKFNLDINNLEKVLSNYDCNILKEKLKYNIGCLKQKKSGNPTYLNLETFSKFLLNISNVISKELIQYADKYGKLPICIRQ